jgi:hypothetical protein
VRSLVATLAAVSTLLPVGARAQSCSCEAPPAARWSVFASAGAGLVDAVSTNAHLTPLGYPALSRDAVAVGAGGFISFGELKLGLEHVRLDAGEESGANGLSARLTGSYTTATVGWELRPGARVSLAPTLGVGRGHYSVEVADRAGGATPPASPPPTFDEVAAAPGRGSTLGGAHWVFEPQLAAELLVLRRASDRLGITIGARVGYRVAPNRPDWEYRGERAAGGPVDQAKGPIARLTIGLGGR